MTSVFAYVFQLFGWLPPVLEELAIAVVTLFIIIAICKFVKLIWDLLPLV